MRKFNIKVNGTAYEVEVDEVGGVASAPVAAPVAAVASAPVAAAPVAAAPSGGNKIEAPMPGDIRKLCVANGATVSVGDKIVVLEAMKMENDITSPFSGVVTYAVKEGDHVDSNAVIAYIK